MLHWLHEHNSIVPMLACSAMVLAHELYNHNKKKNILQIQVQCMTVFIEMFPMAGHAVHENYTGTKLILLAAGWDWELQLRRISQIASFHSMNLKIMMVLYTI